MLDDNPMLWHWFQVWLNRGHLRDKLDLSVFGWKDFLTYYFFAVEKDVSVLQNQLMDVMGDLIQKFVPSSQMVELIWTKTGAESPLRKLIIEGFVYEHYARTMIRYNEYTNTKFLLDLVRCYQDISVTITNQSWRPAQVPCRYHIHGPEDPPCQQVLVQAANGLPTLQINGHPTPHSDV